MKTLKLIIVLCVLGLVSTSVLGNDELNLVGKYKHLLSQSKTQEARHHIRKIKITPTDSNEFIDWLLWEQFNDAKAVKELLKSKILKTKNSAWVNLVKLNQACLAKETKGILRLSKIALLPKSYPSRYADQQYLKWLDQQSIPQLEAGVEVISERKYKTLFALKKLDMLLSNFNKKDKTIIAYRDQLRLRYDLISTTLIEKLFSLKLLNKTSEVKIWLGQWQVKSFLKNPKALQELLRGHSRKMAWANIIKPIYENELGFIKKSFDAVPHKKESYELTIKADLKKILPEGIKYEGHVQVNIAHIKILSDEVLLVKSFDQNHYVINGKKVILSGLKNYTQLLSDQLQLNTGTLKISLDGKVQLISPKETQKLQVCLLNKDGEILSKESLLGEYAKLKDIKKKQACIKKMVDVYTIKEMPGEAAYIHALMKLNKIITWHESGENRMEVASEVLAVEESEWQAGGGQLLKAKSPWQEGHVGAKWMWQAAIQEAEKRGEPFYDNRMHVSKDSPLYWRLMKDKKNEVKNIIEILRKITATDFKVKAVRLIADLKRNNTVLTLDMPSVFEMGKGEIIVVDGKNIIGGLKSQVVLDVRNVDHLKFRLYKVSHPQQLVDCLTGIGRDFIFRFFEDEDFDKIEKLADVFQEIGDEVVVESDLKKVAPKLKNRNLVSSWELNVSSMKRASVSGKRDEDHALSEERKEVLHYYNERYSDDFFKSRLEYRYGIVNEEFSSWSRNLLVKLPKDKLLKKGAYILEVSANGVSSFAPILVKPLDMTLGRAADGVIAVVESKGKPVGKVDFYSTGKLSNKPMSDKNGVAFCKFLALGDKAIVAHKNGQYAIGGFGNVFEGCYYTEKLLRNYFYNYGGLEEVEEVLDERVTSRSLNLFSDNLILGAYTDRPIYRPGQKAEVKLVVRAFKDSKNVSLKSSESFREGDFLKEREFLLIGEKKVTVELVDNSNKVVGVKETTLSEFGSAIASFHLSDDAKVGLYSLRITVKGQPNILRNVFRVKHYRRPNFKMIMTPIKAHYKKNSFIRFSLKAKYYFGKPVSNSLVRVSILRKNGQQVVTSKKLKTTVDGDCSFAYYFKDELMTDGEYQLHVVLIAKSGRSIDQTIYFRYGAEKLLSKAFESLPNFLPYSDEEIKRVVGNRKRYSFLYNEQEWESASDKKLKQSLTYKSYAASVQVTHLNRSHSVIIEPVKNQVTIHFEELGWYRIIDNKRTHYIFIAGDVGPKQNNTKSEYGYGFVNFADSYDKDYFNSLERFKEWSYVYGQNPVWGLIGNHKRKVGDICRILVYLPKANMISKLMVTVDGQTFLDYQVHSIKKIIGKYYYVDVLMKNRYKSNIFLQAQWLDSFFKDFENPSLVRIDKEREAKDKLQEASERNFSDNFYWYKVEVVGDVEAHEKADLKVDLKTDKHIYKPNDLVEVSLQITDKDGKAQYSEISLAAVDQSVYSFLEGNEINLKNAFSAKSESRSFSHKSWRKSMNMSRYLSTAFLVYYDHGTIRDFAGPDISINALGAEDLLALKEGEMSESIKSLSNQEKLEPSIKLSQVIKLPLKGKLPIAQIPMSVLRKNFVETATWQPQLKTDANGEIKTSFVLPDSLTSYRLTAVAITKDTQFGFQRKNITVDLPISCQLMLPRFGVENDLFTAVGLVHNNSSKRKKIKVTFQIQGDVSFDSIDKSWSLTKTEKGLLATKRIEILPRESKRISMPMKCVQSGKAVIILRAGDKEDSDAEKRSLEIRVLGRQREFQLNEKFSGQKEIELPPGLTFDQLQISIADNEMSGSLSGLEYLIQYPYGCVEQTMSRFLPAVMVQQAAKKNKHLNLPWKAMRKLPAVLKKGLRRLYGFQHSDGGWGWWKHDKTNNEMTCYVVYGLAKSRDAGIIIDEVVLKNGCEYLLQQLVRGIDDKLAIDMWFSLSQAKMGDAKLFQTLLKKLDLRQLNPFQWGKLIMIAKQYQMKNDAAILWKKFVLKESLSIEALALKLKIQVSMNKPLVASHKTALKICQQRQGYRWGNTRKTSWAIDSLANFLPHYVKYKKHPIISVILNGKKVPVEKKVKDQQSINGLDLKPHLNLRGSNKIKITADSKDLLSISMNGKGLQKLDKSVAYGKELKITRTFWRNKRRLVGPVKIGDEVEVRVRLKLKSKLSYVMLEDFRPAGFEFANEIIKSPASVKIANKEFWDDRVLLFFNSLPKGTHEFRYFLRAETLGKFHVLPGQCYPMYNEKIKGETAAHKLIIK